MKLVHAMILLSLVIMTFQIERVEKSTTERKSKSQLKSKNMGKTSAKARVTARLGSNYDGWFEGSDGVSVETTMSTKDLNPPTGKLSQKGLIFTKDVVTPNLKNLLIQETQDGKKVWLFPFERMTRSFGFTNPWFTRKYMEASVSNVLFRWTYGFTDISDDDGNALVKQLNKNSKDRSAWIQKQMDEASTYASDFIKHKNAIDSASLDINGVNQKITQVEASSKAINDQKTVAKAIYDDNEANIADAEKELAALRKQRTDLSSQINQREKLIDEQNKSVKTLQGQQSAKTQDSSAYKATVTKSKDQFTAKIKILKVEAETAMTLIDTATKELFENNNLDNCNANIIKILP